MGHQTSCDSFTGRGPETRNFSGLWTREVAQWVKRSQCKREDQSSNPRDPRKHGAALVSVFQRKRPDPPEQAARLAGPARAANAGFK